MTDERERLAAWCEERAQWIMSRDDAAKCKDIAALLREPVNARLLEALQEYGAHEPSCLMAQWHEGRPTKDGGYETRYGDVWYPRGEQPPCSCGLMDAIAAAESAPPQAAHSETLLPGEPSVDWKATAEMRSARVERLTTRIAELERYGEEYIKQTDPLLDCGYHTASKGEGPTGPCGMCRACLYTELARLRAQRVGVEEVIGQVRSHVGQSGEIHVDVVERILLRCWPGKEGSDGAK